MVRTLTSLHCGSGLIPPRPDMSLSLVLLAPSFFLGYFGFPLSSKTSISKFQFDLEFEGHRFVSCKTVRCYPSLSEVNLFFI